MAQRVTEEDLRERFRALDDGRSFWEHAEEAGYEPARWRESIHVLDDLIGLDRDAHRAGARAPGHGQPDRHRDRDRRLRPRRRRPSTAAATTPARRRWTCGSTRRLRWRRRSSSSSGSRAPRARAPSARSARSRSHPGLINAIAERDPVLARHPGRRRGGLRRRRTRARELRAARRGGTRDDGGRPRAPDARPRRRSTRGSWRRSRTLPLATASPSC